MMIKFGLVFVLCMVHNASGLLGLFDCFKSPKAWNSFHAHYEVLPWNGFFDMPKSTNDNLLGSYVKVDADLGAPADLYCLDNDPRVCPFFDKAGNTAGIQISLIEKDLTPNMPYDYSRFSLFTKTNYFNQSAWSVRVWFTNPETLTAAGRKNVGETADGLFLYLDGALVEMPRKDPNQAVHNGFVRQACFPGMGLHYFYGLNETSKCEDTVTLFSLYQSGSLVGFGVGGFGTQTQATRNWFEKPPGPAIRLIAPHRPPCLLEWLDKYTITTVHVYLVDKPWSYLCIP